MGLAPTETTHPLTTHTRSVSFEVAHFEDGSVATLENAEELKPEAPAKPFSGIRTSLALQASIAGLLANLSSNSATSKLTLRVTDWP